MKLSKTLVLPTAALLVVVGAGAVLATSSSAPAADHAVVPAATSPSPAPSAATGPTLKDTVLSDVLDQLVAKGTITAAQQTAILDAVTAERAARRSERQQRLQQLRTFLADGQITQDELNQLPADSPLRQLTALMDDGKITIDELRSIGRGMLRDLGGRGLGKGLRGGGLFGNPTASPAPSTGTSG